MKTSLRTRRDRSSGQSTRRERTSSIMNRPSAGNSTASGTSASSLGRLSEIGALVGIASSIRMIWLCPRAS